MTHELKVWPRFFEDIELGRKTFEVRLNDRRFQIGDVLVLQEWDEHRSVYTGRTVVRHVVYMVEGRPWLPDEVCVMGISPTPGTPP